MEEIMGEPAYADQANESPRGGRPMKSFKQGGLEVAIWKNGDMYNTTISNSYKDDKTGEWKETKSFSPTDLAVLSQLSSQAFQTITEFKGQNRGR